MSRTYLAVRTPAVKQKDGSIKGRQTFHPTIDSAVKDLDENAGAGATVDEIVSRAMTSAEITAARERILAKAKP